MPEEVASSLTAEQSLDANKPIPIRFWWLKRFILCGLLFIVTIAAARLWWGWDTNRRLQAEINRIVAAGEPIFPQEFNSKFVRDKDNAAKMITDAARALDLSTEDRELIYRMSRVPNEALGDKPLYQLRAIVARNTTCLDRLRTSRSRSRLDWGTTIASPAIDTLIPNISDFRELSRLLSAAAAYHIEKGNHGEAVERLRDILCVARNLDEVPFLVSHLAADACVVTATRRIEAQAPHIIIQRPSTSPPPGVIPATRKQVDALVADLLDVRYSQRSYVRAMYSERMMVLDLFQEVLDGTFRSSSRVTPGSRHLAAPSDPRFVFAFRPVFVLDALTALDYSAHHVEAARCYTWPEAVRRIPQEPKNTPVRAEFLNALSLVLAGSLDRSHLIHHQRITERRLAALTLAVRLYELDHGQRPGDLEQLVPDYLISLPADPFATDGGRLRYNALASPAVVYSVGQNGVDDHGKWATHPNSHRISWEDNDFPYFLNGNRPGPKEENEEAAEASPHDASSSTPKKPPLK